MTNLVVIVGAGGFGREVLEIFKCQNKISNIWGILGFIDEDSRLRGKMINGYPVLGDLGWFKEHDNKNLGCVCTIGECEARSQVVERLQKIGVKYYNAIHPSVVMSEFVELGNDVIIGAGSVLTANIKIGDHVHINLNTTVGHDTEIGDCCTINPMVAISGNCNIGRRTYIGSGTTVIQNISVGSDSIVGAGSVVIRNLPSNVTACGVPARVIKNRS